MIIASNNAEGGSNGAVPSVLDIGSGTMWNEVFADTDKIKYSNLHPAHGTLCYEFSPSTASVRIRWGSGILGMTTNMYGIVSLYTTGSPSISNRIVSATDSAGSMAWAINFSSTSRIIIKNTTDTTLWMSTSRLPHGQWSRIEWCVMQSSSPASIQVKIFYGLDYITPAEVSGPITGNYLSTTSMVAFGPMVASVPMPLMYLDDISLADQANGWIGPAGTPVPNPRVGWGSAPAR